VVQHVVEQGGKQLSKLVVDNTFFLLGRREEKPQLAAQLGANTRG